MGKAAKGQISQFARDVFSGQAVAAGRAQVGAQIQQIDLEAMMEDPTWLDELASLGGDRMLLGGSATSGGVDGGENAQALVGAGPEGMKSTDVTGWM